MKILLFTLCCANLLFAQKQNNCQCKDPRFIWRTLTFGNDLFFIKQGDKIAYTDRDSFEESIYLINKNKKDKDSLYLEYKKNLFDSTNFENINFLVEVKVDIDSLNFFCEIKNKKGLDYLLNEYLEPETFVFKKEKISILFLYFLFQNCIPVGFASKEGFCLNTVFDEWYPDLFLKIAANRITKKEFEDWEKRLKINHYE